jgi:hypothetical protein
MLLRARLGTEPWHVGPVCVHPTSGGLRCLVRSVRVWALGRVRRLRFSGAVVLVVEH